MGLSVADQGKGREARIPGGSFNVERNYVLFDLT